MTPELQMKLAQQSGYDGIDINNYESNCKLAEKRLNYIKETAANPQLEQAYQQMEMQMTDPKTGARATDPVGNPIMNPILGQILSASILQVNSQAENHEQHIDFWSRKCREFMSSGKDQPQVLIAICDAMITRHKGAAFTEATKNQALAGLSTLPAQAGSHMAAQALTPAPPEEKTQKTS
jgi:hypothetical protein